MLGLPKETELNKQLPKSAIYTKFQMNRTAKEKMDRDISRIYIVNEVSASRVNLSVGKEIKSFFVLSVLLKHKKFDEKNIIALSKLIPQNMVMVLEYEEEAKLAVYHVKLMQTEWLPKERLSLELKGLDLDSVWGNIIIQIGNFTVEYGNSLDEQISKNEQREKLQKKIDKLERLARAEKQPKKKFELVSRIRDMEKELNKI